MNCHKCGKDTLRTHVDLFLDIPARLNHGLNKEVLRDKDVRIMGANWPTARLYCTDWKCGFSQKGT